MRFNISKQNLRIWTYYVISSLSIILVLFVLGIILVLVINTKDIARQTKENLVITLILKDASKQKINKFLAYLSKQPYVKNIKYISKEEAFDEIKNELGRDIDQLLDYNPLPATIDLNLKEQYANSDSIYLIRNKLLNIDIVNDVYYNREIVKQLDKNIERISLILSTLGVILVLISIILINNTVRLAVYNKRFEIKTMQMIGAHWWFILKPFVKSSLLHGLLSSLFAVAFIVVLLNYFQANTENLLRLYHLPEVFLIIVILGTFMTFLSTVISVFIFISKPIERLYF